MPGNKLIFRDAELARNSITRQQKTDITNLYKEWEREVGKRAEYYKNKTTSSSVVSEMQMRELQKFIRESGKEIHKQIMTGVTGNIYIVSDSVVRNNAQWLKSLGFNSTAVDIAMSSIPTNIVNNIITGQIYESGWSLSQRIWSMQESTMKTAYQIVAGGMAQNKSIYQISKDLQKYVQPGARKAWNLRDKDGRLIYPGKIDYNAQRLARTLVQHGYQQSFMAVTQGNPFIIDYIWLSNGSRVCEICRNRDGEHYKKDELPMDHPNGMCTMVPNVVSDLTTQLANWFNADPGEYPDIDEFASNFGYNP